MPKFTFISEDLDLNGYKTGSKTTKEFTCESLDDIIAEFEMFVRGTGYHFEGNFNILNESDYSDKSVSCSDAEYIAVLKEEIQVLKFKFKPNEEGTGHYNTAINVLQERIKEIQSASTNHISYPTDHYHNIK